MIDARAGTVAAVVIAMIGCEARTGPVVPAQVVSAAPTASAAKAPPAPADDGDIAVGRWHSCARLHGGAVRCWGGNTRGQLGTPDRDARDVAVAVPGVTDAVDLALGEDFSCARLAARDVVCWGGNFHGQLGRGTETERESPGPVNALEDAVAIRAGEAHVCALRGDHTVWCWGKNHVGQLGDGTSQSRSTPVRVPLDDAMAIGAGAYHTCALTTDGTTWCWGMGSSGQLGESGGNARTRPVRATAFGPGTAIVVGGRTTCVRVESGMRCRGDDPRELVGMPLEAPWSLAELGAATQIAISQGAICGRRSDGSILCASSKSPKPSVLVAGGAEQVAIAMEHACARLANGAIQCWGSNTVGAVGDGTLDVTRPVAIANLESVVQIAASSRGTCARKTDGRAWCWGDTHFSTGAEDAAVPVLLAQADVARLAIGEQIDAALLRNGTVVGRGDNQRGPLLGAPKDFRAPLSVVAGVRDVVALANGWDHLCAIDRTAHVLCWGANGVGQVGIGKTSAFEGPSRIASLARVVEVAAGGDFSYARRDDGTVFAWGGYRGNAHDAIPASHVTTTPKLVVPLKDVAQLAASRGRACARTSSGAVTCWAHGEVDRPSAIPDLRDAIHIAIGDRHACAVKKGGSLVCWGRNSSGELGDGTTIDRETPAPVVGIDAVIDIAIGESHTCALRSDGHVWCWGRGGSGQRGDGVTDQRRVPSNVKALTDPSPR